MGSEPAFPRGRGAGPHTPPALGAAGIPAAVDVDARRVRDLPGDITLKPGELRIEFFGAEDLAAKLFELSQAMANDWQAFARAVEEENKG